MLKGFGLIFVILLKTELKLTFTLCFENVSFGFVDSNSDSLFVWNLLIIYGNFVIHKCKFTDKKKFFLGRLKMFSFNYY